MKVLESNGKVSIAVIPAVTPSVQVIPVAATVIDKVSVTEPLLLSVVSPVTQMVFEAPAEISKSVKFPLVIVVVLAPNASLDK